MRPIEEEPPDKRRQLQKEVGLQHEGQTTKPGRKPRRNRRRKQKMDQPQHHEYPRNRRIRDAADEASEYLDKHAGVKSVWNTARDTAVTIVVAAPPLIGVGYVLMLIGRKVFRPL